MIKKWYESSDRNHQFRKTIVSQLGTTYYTTGHSSTISSLSPTRKDADVERVEGAAKNMVLFRYRNSFAMTNGDRTVAAKFNLTSDEYVRRHNMVVEQAALCDFYDNEHVWPADEKDYQKYGMCLAKHISKDYYDFCSGGLVSEWKPYNGDMPFVVTAYSYKTKQNFVCSGGFLTSNKPAFVQELLTNKENDNDACGC